jgi:hypothetical protein
MTRSYRPSGCIHLTVCNANVFEFDRLSNTHAENFNNSSTYGHSANLNNKKYKNFQ